MTSTAKRVSLILDDCSGDLSRSNALHCLLRWVLTTENPQLVMTAFVLEAMSRGAKDKGVLYLCGVFSRNVLVKKKPDLLRCIDRLELELPVMGHGYYLGSNASGHHYFWDYKGRFVFMDSGYIPYSKTSFGWRLAALAGFVPLNKIKWTVTI
jgi:hypothetical protein